MGRGELDEGQQSVAVWLWLATKGRTVALLPLPSLGWGGEWKDKGKNSWVGIRAI